MDTATLQIAATIITMQHNRNKHIECKQYETEWQRVTNFFDPIFLTNGSKLGNRHTLPQDSRKSNIYHIYYQDMGLLQVWSSKKLLCLAQWYLNYQTNHDNLYYFLILIFVKNNVCKILYFLPYYRFVQDSPLNYLHLIQLANIVCSLQIGETLEGRLQ